MSKILVFVEHHNNKIKRSSIELLQFAAQSGQPVLGFVVGSSAAQLAQDISANGATEVHICKDASFDQYNSELYTNAFAEVISKTGATAVLASASSLGKDLFPRVAAKLDAGLISDGTEISLSGNQLTVKKPMYSGKCFATASFEDGSLQIVLMRANQLPVVAAAASTTAPITEHVFSSSQSLKTLVKEIVKGASEKLDLTEANIIISGGRGLKEAGNFKLLNDLADVLGATVGATRAVVDAGWVPHSMQVGQTGKTVAPTLYIAVGLSGAIQHLAGMSGAKVVVAINNDASAPIFSKATYGIVGDAFEVLPLLAEEFKKALQH